MNLRKDNQSTIIWPEFPKTEEEVIERLKKTPSLYGSYCRLNGEWRQRMMDGDTLLIMDMLGELEDVSLINVEIRKQSYAFPAERITCYSSDLVMRQYVRVKGCKGNTFTYRDIKKVYVIVIFEQSMGIFHKMGEHYIHHGETKFDTGLPLELLQEFYLVALDVFRKIPYHRDRSECTAWLSLLTTEHLEDAEALVREYPWLEEIYEEAAMLRQRPEEVLGMFSEALQILDENTVKYMIEEGRGKRSGNK